jgi:Mg2+ and Co2+ transporter CorA
MLDQTSPALTGDFPGLSFAYRFRDGLAERIAPAELRRALTEPGGWIWLHFGLAEPGVRSWIEHEAPIPERAKAILLSDDEHLLLEPIDGGIAGVFADLLRESEGETRQLGRLRFALMESLVISGRRDALGAIARTLKAIDSGKRFPSAVALLESIVSHFADAVAVVAEELAETLDLIEEHLIDDTAADDRRKLGPVRRTAVRLHRQLAALRLLFRRWSMPNESGLPPALAEAAGRLALRLDGLDHEIAAIQERSRLLQDEIAAKAAAETNRHLFVLTILTALLLPPTLVSGIFGMNVSDLPFTKEPGGFTWAMALLIGATVAIYAVLRLMRIMR